LRQLGEKNVLGLFPPNPSRAKFSSFVGLKHHHPRSFVAAFITKPKRESFQTSSRESATPTGFTPSREGFFSRARMSFLSLQFFPFVLTTERKERGLQREREE
jgi:hypothetical protein